MTLDVFNQTGWTEIDKQHAFITNSGALIANGLRSDVDVQLDSALGAYALPKPPKNPRDAIRASLRFLGVAPLTVTVPIWAAMYAAPLMPFKALFATMWVSGASGGLKSQLAKLALSHFGARFLSPNGQKSVCSWNSTFASLEQSLHVIKDAPLVIDDFPTQDDTRMFRQKAGSVLMMVGNRSASGRGVRDGAQPDMSPCAFAISIAEEEGYGFGAQSNESRLIRVPVQRVDERLLALQMSGDGYGHYSEAMSAYIAWIAKNWEALEHALPSEYEVAAQEARAILPPNWSRLTDYYAVLLVAARVALRFALTSKSITKAQHDDLGQSVFPYALKALLLRNMANYYDAGYSHYETNLAKLIGKAN